MMGFFLSFKQKGKRSKTYSSILQTVLQIELVAVVLVQMESSFFKGVFHLMVNRPSESFTYPLIGMLIFYILVTATVLQQGNADSKSQFYSKSLHEVSIHFVKDFTYIFWVPFSIFSLMALNLPSEEATSDSSSSNYLGLQAVGIVNFLIGTGFAVLNEASSGSVRFAPVDFCCRRSTSPLYHVGLIVIFITCVVLSSNPIYHSIFLALRALYCINSVWSCYEYELQTKNTMFWGVIEIYLVFLVLMESLMGVHVFDSFVKLTVLLLFAGVVSRISRDSLLVSKRQKMAQSYIQEAIMGKNEENNNLENVKNTLTKYENCLRIFAKVYYSRQNYLQNPKSAAASAEYQHWWQIFDKRILSHKINCSEPHCSCSSLKSSSRGASNESSIYIRELLRDSERLYQLNTKETVLKIISIYLYVEIAKKPLKAYYEIMRLKQQGGSRKGKVSSSVELELEDLTQETRECFDQVFLKNKAKNQKLELLKVIEYEENINGLQRQLESLTQKVILFHENIFHSSIKLSKLKQESKELFTAKNAIEERIYNLILNFAQNARIEVMIYIFYHHLEVYKSKENELKKISSQQQLKKRIYHKNEVDIFSEEYGSIFIDLIGERGKILNLTSNICGVFGYQKEDMQSFNIKRFMPTIYAKFHNKFLSNFIEKGKIKLLRERERVVFGKAKSKFIFPINVRLKAEYLIDRCFGASSLINLVETNSDFIVVGKNGKIEEISERIFGRVFGKVLDDPSRIGRFNAYKLLPSLNQAFEEGSDLYNNDPATTNSVHSKIHEGLIVYSEDESTMLDKFRVTKEPQNGASSTVAASISKSSSISGGASNFAVSFSNTASGMFTTKSETAEFLTESYKCFLAEINIFRLKGLKISYKYSILSTAEFELNLVEIVSVEKIEDKKFYSLYLAELNNIAEIYHLNEDHSVVQENLLKMKQIIEEDRIQEYSAFDINEKPRRDGFKQDQADHSCSRQVGGDQPARARRSSAQALGTINSGGMLDDEDNGSIGEFLENDSFLPQGEAGQPKAINYQASESSLTGSTESESKKQILINAFNARESVLTESILILLFVGLALLIVLLLVSVYTTVNFFSVQQQLWKDWQFSSQMVSYVEFRMALLEMDLFENNLNSSLGVSLQSENLVETGSLQINDWMVQLLETINEKIFQHPSYRFQLQKMTMLDSKFPTDSEMHSQEISVLEGLNRLLWKFQYESNYNNDTLRLNYQHLHTDFQNYRLKKAETVSSDMAKYEIYNMVSVGLYSLVLLLTAVIVIPIYNHYRKKEAHVSGLIAHMNSKEVRKSIKKFQLIRDLLKKEEENLAIVIEGLSEKHESVHRRTQGGAGSELQNSHNDKADDQDLEFEGLVDMHTTSASTGGKLTKVIHEGDISDQSFLGQFGKKLLILLALVAFFLNFGIVSYVLVSGSSLEFGKILSTNEKLQDLQNKAPMLLNIYISNINRFLQNEALAEYSEQMYTETTEGYFDVTKMLSEISSSSALEITQRVDSDVSSNLCLIVDCSNSNSRNLSFEYLVYEFKNKFNFFSPTVAQSGSSLSTAHLTTSMIEEWVAKNDIQANILWLEQILAYSKRVNDEIDLMFKSSSSELFRILLVLGSILVSLNVLALWLLQKKFIRALNQLLIQSEDMFRHFGVSVLAENTYLTSYFNSKLKQNK